MDDVTVGRNGREAQNVEAARCSDGHEWCGDTGVESDVYECSFGSAEYLAVERKPKVAAVHCMRSATTWHSYSLLLEFI